MPFLGLGAHVLVAIFFAIHAMRTGRNTYWLFILFAFPLLGSIVYFFVEFLPELRGHRAMNATGKAVRKLVNPGAELRDAERALALTPTMDNRIRLATALLDAGRYDEAIAQYQEAAVGLHEFDPALNLGLARTLLAQNRGVEARSVVERYMHHESNRLPGDMPLLYAQALAASQDQGAAVAQYERVLAADPTPEARSRFGAYLRSIGRHEEADRVLNDFLKDADHWPKHVRALNREWLGMAREAQRRAS